MLEISFNDIYAADEIPQGKLHPIPDASGSPEQRRNLPRILVVDDERRIVDTLSEILGIAGFHVASAYDGWKALEIATRFQPDYLLSDVLMPHMNGVDLAIEVRRICPLAKILLFSGQAGISDIVAEGQLRGFEFEMIAKPIHPLKLIERLKAENQEEPLCNSWINTSLRR
jgi:DNA-binding response OmpR family regulator